MKKIIKTLILLLALAGVTGGAVATVKHFREQSVAGSVNTETVAVASNNTQNNQTDGQDNVEELKETITGLRSDNEMLANKIVELNDSIYENENENENRIENLTNEKVVLENRVAELQNLNETVTAEKQAEIDALNLSLADLQSEIDTLNADNAEQLAELTNRKTELENQVTKLQGDIETLTAESQAAIGELNATITGLNDRIQELETSNASYIDRVAELTNQKTALETQVAELQAGNTSAEQQVRIDELESLVSELQAQLNELNNGSAVNSKKYQLTSIETLGDFDGRNVFEFYGDYYVSVQLSYQMKYYKFNIDSKKFEYIGDSFFKNPYIQGENVVKKDGVYYCFCASDGSYVFDYENQKWVRVPYDDVSKEDDDLYNLLGKNIRVTTDGYLIWFSKKGVYCLIEYEENDVKKCCWIKLDNYRYGMYGYRYKNGKRTHEVIFEKFDFANAEYRYQLVDIDISNITGVSRISRDNLWTDGVDIYYGNNYILTEVA